ncbi:hypothetical protein [Undibacterium sp. RuTC16W]|uniref:hypothetical protein n=1 Tax=Undibacterium sp. RuTC16W TaxID=3413048 RepID=UPI003BEFD9B5
MTPKKILYWLLLFVFLQAATLEYFDAYLIREPLFLHFLYLGITAYFIVAWYHFDTIARGYRRSTYLNAGMIFLSVVALPYYLLRSRNKGTRLKAIMSLLGFCLLMGIVSIAGSLVGHLMFAK